MTPKIVHYHLSLQGKSHIARDICCQDASRTVKLNNQTYLGVVADGVGSAKHSEIGAKIATDTIVDFFEKHDTQNETISHIKDLFYQAFQLALDNIIAEALAKEQPLPDYDTTLSAALYDGHQIVYGHSGDGAIIGLTTSGQFVEVTRAQKDEDCVGVIPLRGGRDTWEIAASDGTFVSILLVTDGMLDTICPPLLKEKSIHKVYVPLGSFFMDPYGLSQDSNEAILEEIRAFVQNEEGYNINRFYGRLADIYANHIPNSYQDIIENELYANHYPLKLMQAQGDDKTLACMANLSSKCHKQTVDFFKEPNWEMLQETLNSQLYASQNQDNIQEHPQEENAEEKEIRRQGRMSAIMHLFDQGVRDGLAKLINTKKRKR